jgi:hypothetical protein
MQKHFCQFGRNKQPNLMDRKEMRTAGIMKTRPPAWCLREQAAPSILAESDPEILGKPARRSI